jgi:hypothetical protein
MVKSVGGIIAASVYTRIEALLSIKERRHCFYTKGVKDLRLKAEACETASAT